MSQLAERRDATRRLAPLRQIFIYAEVFFTEEESGHVRRTMNNACAPHCTSVRGEKYLATPDRACNWHVPINNNGIGGIEKFGAHVYDVRYTCVGVCTCGCTNLAPVHLSV